MKSDLRSCLGRETILFLWLSEQPQTSGGSCSASWQPISIISTSVSS